MKNDIEVWLDLYLIASRPDIMFSVCLCARYQSNVKESHLCALKRIFKYLLGTKNFRLWYLKKNSQLDLLGYSMPILHVES